MLPTFGFIGEGITDFAVLENILVGFFEDDDISMRITELMPSDATDRANPEMGGWSRVITYCQTEKFRNNWLLQDFLIIQMDTDRAHEIGITIDKNTDVQDTVKQFIEYFEHLIMLRFGADFHQKYKQKIIFAIAVNAIECWILPLHYDKKFTQEQAATKQCLALLERKLKTKIDKKRRVYADLSRGFERKKTLVQACTYNPSFHLFIQDLQQKTNY
jgi:hypothetical protein